MPAIVRDCFKYDWLDYHLVGRVVALFNKYFATKSYLALRKGQPNDKFIEVMFDTKNNLEPLRDCEYYLPMSQQRGILLSIAGIYAPLVAFCSEANIDCQQEILELTCLGKLTIALG